MKTAYAVFLIFWALLLVTLYSVLGYNAVTAASGLKEASLTRHTDRVHPDLFEADKTEPEPMPVGAQPQEVEVGLYMDRIPAISIRESTWTADFYVWFLWTDPSYSPGENLQVIDGTIEEYDLEKIHDRVPLEDGRLYSLYRIEAQITKFFDVKRFPRDDHLLTIKLEDSALTFDKLTFVPDDSSDYRGGSKISSRVKIPGYQIYQMTATAKPHSYQSLRGDPRLARGLRPTHSQFLFGVWIKRESWGYYFKLFQGLYVAVGIALMALLVPPDRLDARFGLAVGALFAAVANNYIVSSLLPDTGVMSLADTINSLGMGTIFLVIVIIAIAYFLTLKENGEKLARRFDGLSFLVVTVAFVVLNVAIPYAGSLSARDVAKSGGDLSPPAIQRFHR